MEVLCKVVQVRRFVNRGFLIGPICPIYGFGVLGILLLIGKTPGDILSVFLKSILICSALEYFTSYIMEKLFKARWWDYSKNKFNINGRICLETMLPFGLLGTVIVYFVNPFLSHIIEKIPSFVRLILAIIIFIVYLIDNIISFNVLNKIKSEIKRHKVDSSEIIRKKVMKWLEENTVLYRHIKNAYPKFKIIRLNRKERNKKDS